NMPHKDSWQPPLPGSDKLTGDLKSWKGKLAKATGRDIDAWAKKVAQKEMQLKDAVDAAKYDYRSHTVKDADGKERKIDPIEELVQWRLWDRTGGGLMAELGSHQLDAASIFISAMHGGEKQHPIRVMAAGNRPIFPADRDIDDHVACIFEFPMPGYNAKSELDARRKIGVQYASINGNGFGGYGEIVYGTKGTLILEKEQNMELMLNKTSAKVAAGASAGPTMDTQASGAAQEAVDTGPKRKVSRGYREELEHWAWCIQNPAPENKPRCHPKVALGDAVIAHVTNLSAKEGRPIEFKEAWFDIHSDETPEGVKPDLSRYA
ncbi:MAG: gfo/Idh/MocA family oxidoreductase, partial [Planctomycetia bacterium]